MSKIIILRHAEAGFNTIDKNRILTPFGITQAKKIGTELSNYKINLIIHSNYIRAIQTAEIILKEINNTGINPIVLVTDKLTPDSDVKDFINYLDKILIKSKNIENILLVSHLPLVFNLQKYFNDINQLDNKYLSNFPTASYVTVDYIK